MAEKDLLSKIQVSKSDLAKALMTGNKDLIEKHRRELEDLRNAWEALDNEEMDGGCSGNDDGDEDEYQPTDSDDYSDDYDYYSDGWNTEDDSKAHDKGAEHGKVGTKSIDEEVKPNKACEENAERRNEGGEDEMKGKSSKKKKKTQAKRKREVRPCPLKGCKSRVIHLPRHLRDVHKWTKEKACKANSRFGLRESFKTKSVESDASEARKKDYHHHRPCPIPGCTSVVKRLSNHLQQVHTSIKKGTPKYKNILREARLLKTWKWRHSGQGKTSSEMSDEAQDVPGDSVHLASACTSKNEKEQQNGYSNHLSNQVNQDDSVEESHDVDEVDDSGVTELQWNDNESTIMGNAEDDIEDTSVELDMSIFNSFCQWLTTADGGRKDPKLSKQHASQLSRILTVIDPNKQLASLFDKSLIRDKFLKEYAENKYQADTIKAYLLSLRHFCSYIIAEKPKSIKVNSAIVLQIEEKARLWSASYKKDSNRRHLQKMNEDLGNLVTPQMVTDYERSESARSAVSHIGQLSGAHSLLVSQAIYTLVRDFILLEMTIANAHRSGVLANMTVAEFKKAKRTEESFVITVKKHKTADTHGPARVVLSPTLYSYLRVYVQEVRSQVQRSSSNDEEDEDAVFLSWSGAKLESGQVSTAINAAWHKGGMEGHISSTIFRKSAVTSVHANHREITGDLADLMAHKETTARKFYRVREKQEACLQAATHLTSIMRSSSTEDKFQGPSIHSKGVSNDDTPTSSLYDKTTATGSSKERISWKEEDVLAVKELFAKEIEEQSVTMPIVRMKIHDHPTLQHLGPKKVLDKVRSEWRDCSKSKREDQETANSEPPITLPEEREALSDKMGRFFSTEESNSSSLVSGKVKVFGEEARNIILKLCGGMVKAGAISKPAVKETLEKDEVGREMLVKFTLDQIINRLKYERRLNNRRSESK